MTCIVGIIDTENSQIIMGGDCLGSDSRFASRERQDVKVFIKDDRFIMGFTSSYRMGQILHYTPLHIDQQEACEDDMAFMVKKFIPAVQKVFADNGWDLKDRDGERRSGVFLVGYKSHLYKVEGDFQVEELYKPYNACGCGEDYALGALYAMEGSDMDDKCRVMQALEAAAYFSGGVRGPHTIKTLKY